MFAAKALLANARRSRQVNLQIFDVVLIHEGQDLVTVDAELGFETQQTFYSLVYQLLNPARREKILLKNVTKVKLRQLAQPLGRDTEPEQPGDLER